MAKTLGYMITWTTYGTWDILGKHLRNAYGQYDEGQKKLDRFGMHLDQIQEVKEEEI